MKEGARGCWIWWRALSSAVGVIVLSRRRIGGRRHQGRGLGEKLFGARQEVYMADRVAFLVKWLNVLVCNEGVMLSLGLGWVDGLMEGFSGSRTDIKAVQWMGYWCVYYSFMEAFVACLARKGTNYGYCTVDIVASFPLLVS